MTAEPARFQVPLLFSVDEGESTQPEPVGVKKQSRRGRRFLDQETGKEFGRLVHIEASNHFFVHFEERLFVAINGLGKELGLWSSYGDFTKDLRVRLRASHRKLHVIDVLVPRKRDSDPKRVESRVCMLVEDLDALYSFGKANTDVVETLKAEAWGLTSTAVPGPASAAVPTSSEVPVGDVDSGLMTVKYGEMEITCPASPENWAEIRLLLAERKR